MPELAIAVVGITMVLVTTWTLPSHLMSNYELLEWRSNTRIAECTTLLSRTVGLVGAGVVVGWAVTDPHVPSLARGAALVVMLSVIGVYSAMASRRWTPQMTHRRIAVSFVLGLVLALSASRAIGPRASAILVGAMSLHYVIVRSDGTYRFGRRQDQ